MRRAGIAGTVVSVALIWSAPAAAGTFVVDSRKDGNDVTSADDVCATVTGECTLRAAIDASNQSAPDDLITIPGGTYRLKLATDPGGGNDEGELDVTQPVEIEGAGRGETVIQQTVGDRVLRNDAMFEGFSQPGLRLSGVTLTGGRVGGAGENGGAGLQNNGFALLNEVTIKRNVANSDGSDDVPGGGVYTNGILGMAATTVRENVARGRGEAHPKAAGIYVEDGGLTIQDGSKVVANKVEIRRPEGASGAQAGGMLLRNQGGDGDTVSIRESTVAGNTALGGSFADGGGIFAGSGVNLEVDRSTISGNRSERGGGLYLVGLGAAAITNSTISGNLDTAEGGAAFSHQAGAGDIDLTHVTIAGNDASPGHFPIEGGEQTAAGAVTSFGSIVANPGRECGPPAEDGSVVSDGRNVFGDRSCGFDGAAFDAREAAELKPLASNGGPTRTHALKATSPAIDHVPCGPGIDQRGVPRPQQAECDSGSFEKKF
jgi:hypothetical protein